MVKVEDTRSTGLNCIDKKSSVEIPRETLDKIQKWISSREFDEDNMFDMHRTKEFRDYLVDLERHNHKNDVTIYHEDCIASVNVSDFLEL